MRNEGALSPALLRVLFVDSDPDETEMYRIALGLLAIEVDASTSAAEAIEMFDRTWFDAIVSDLVLPRLSGFDFLRHVRACGSARAFVPAIALSGLLGDEIHRRALACGFDAHVAKPCLPSTLAEHIRRLLERRRL